MRIASQKTQQRIFVVGEPLLESETPDQLSLYLPDGTPINLEANPPEPELPSGGDSGTFLAKASPADGDVEWISTPETADELPAGGGSGDLLAKNSTADGDVEWVPASSIVSANELPSGGAAGYILAKASVANGDVTWIPAPSGSVTELPAGGTTGQLLAKVSNADGAVTWVPVPHDLPVGGSSGYLLAKNSSSDRDVGWTAVPHDLPVGGITGHVLTKNSGTDRDVGWAAPSGGSGATGTMIFKGEWAPGNYAKDSVVTHDNKLWVAKADINVVAFSFVGSAWDDRPGTGTISIAVPAGTQVGDLMIWAGDSSAFGVNVKPEEAGWTTLSELSLDATTRGAATLYAKIAQAADLGSTKVYTGASSDYYMAHLLVYRGMNLPIAAEVDFLRGFNNNLGTPLVMTPGADPAETTANDRILRVFMSYSQNFLASAGSDVPIWSANAGGQDRLLTESTVSRALQMGSYWAAPNAADLPSWSCRAGENKFTMRYTLRLISPSNWDPTAWTAIANTELPSGGAINTQLAKTSAADGAVGWVTPSAGGYKGNWLITTAYPAGSIVKHSDGNFYATASPIVTISPTDVPGTNIGTARFGIQGKTTDKIDDGVAVVRQMSTAAVDTNGFKAVPLMVDFTSGSNANINLQIVNNTNEALTFYINGSGGASDSVFSVNAGATQTRSIRFASFWGGSSPHQILMEGTSNATTGSFTATLTGAATNPPDPPNTWEKTSVSSGLPAGGSSGQVLAKNSATNYDAGWITPSGGGGSSTPAGLVLDEKFDTDMSAFSGVSGITVASGYAKLTTIGTPGFFKYTAVQYRDVMIIGEISLDGSAGNPVFDMHARDNGVSGAGQVVAEMLCHDINFHLYKTNGSLLTYQGHGGFVADGRKYWLTLAAAGPWLLAEFFAKMPFARRNPPDIALQSDQSSDAALWTGSSPNKQGPLGEIRIEIGQNVRLHRLQIWDLSNTHPMAN